VALTSEIKMKKYKVLSALNLTDKLS